jgi:hypothetical protein
VGNGDFETLKRFCSARGGFVLFLRVFAGVGGSERALRELRGKAGREIEDRRWWIEN